MRDQLDGTPEESDVLLVEIELTTNLISAATASDMPLSTAEVDRLLGLAQAS